MIVVDVTVLAAFVMNGAETDGVVRLRKRHPEWAAPVLWKSELMNVLWKYERRGDMSVHGALEIMDFVVRLMRDTTFDVQPEEVLPIACSSGCTAYDGQYVALARLLNAPLATHDRQLLRLFPDLAFMPDKVPDSL